ncbi:MAG TPA: DNA replication/repair protein RecF [Pyrinomonadaceae bacterium]|nr:DNA replication/repair protein RecF [Pyrinomonadaceae bacterium]
MLLESLEAHCFRNLSGKISWGPGLNVIFGENGQGKTNWLEAIYLLATTKSFRTQKPQEAVCFGGDLAVVRGTVARTEEVRRELQVAVQNNSKAISVNGKRESVARYLGQLHVVSFTADELEVVRGAPEARRKFLDRGIVSLHHAYVQTIADYQRVIRQKNRLLQDASEAELEADETAERLAPWNEQLVKLSGEIHRARLDYVSRVNEALERRLFEREEITVRYVSSLEGKGDLGDYEGLIAERLKLRMQAEISAGYSLIGPHRDELEILFDGRDIRQFGSSGQQRSALILLDLAAISVYHSWHSEYPVFLLDDVDAELDRKRVSRLLEYLEGRTQTFVTTSKEDLVEQYAARARVFEIAGGMAVETGALREEVQSVSQGVSGI